MVPPSVSGHRRARRPGGGVILLVALVVTVSGCSVSRHPSASHRVHVLGEPKGPTLVTGQPAPAGTGDLGAVSCANKRRCWAVGVAGPDATSAPAGATVIAATINGGVSWKAQHVSGGAISVLSGISCPTASECMAVGSNNSSQPGSGVVVTTSDAGAVWNPATAPAGALTVKSVLCSDAADCLAIVSDGAQLWSARSTDFGHTWQRFGNLPGSFLGGENLSCGAGGACLVAGYVPTTSGHGQGAIALSPDAGQTWALTAVPGGTGILLSAACPSASTCLAGGTVSTTVTAIVPDQGELLRSVDGGHTWTGVTGAPPVDDVYDMECPTTAVCAMVGTHWAGNPPVGTGAVAQSADGGATFEASPAAYVPITLRALSCPTPAGCVAVGGDTVARISLVPAQAQPRHSHASTHR